MLIAMVSWGEKEIFTNGVSDDQKQGEGWGWGKYFAFRPPPFAASISKSYMAG